MCVKAALKLRLNPLLAIGLLRRQAFRSRKRKFTLTFAEGLF